MEALVVELVARGAVSLTAGLFLYLAVRGLLRGSFTIHLGNGSYGSETKPETNATSQDRPEQTTKPED